MNSIFVINKATKNFIFEMDFIPRKEDRVASDNREFIVDCILYNKKENCTLIFVIEVDPYYSAMKIAWR